MTQVWDDDYAQIELIAPHWVLRERQLVNWGSYDGYHTFAPSEADDQTVTLLTGQSESGKSTLLDAQVSLLYPTGAAFNKASNAGRSDRSDYSYLRGQRGIRNDGGHDEAVYLRGETVDGEPYAVWGAIVDRYEDTANCADMSIAKFMYLPAGGSSEDVIKIFAVSSEPLDPRLLDDSRDEAFTIPLLKQVYPGAQFFRQANQFREVVWKRFGLTEAACRLLHRMQASDAPSQLDDIFRKGVLGEPRAVQRGRETADDYRQFEQNFHAMEGSQRRLDVLETIERDYGAYDEARGQVEALRAVDPQREGSAAVRAAWLQARADDDVAEMLPAYETQAAQCAAAVEAGESRIGTLEERAKALQAKIGGAGGERLELLETQLQQASQQARDREVRRSRMASAFERAETAMPADQGAWDALQSELDAFLTDYNERKDALTTRYFELLHERRELAQQLAALEDDYERKRKSGSRITADMRSSRDRIAQAVGLDPAQLPYVAELMDVADDAEEWRVAMNVSYASLAPVILVDKRYENGFAAKVSTIPREELPRRNWQFVDTERSYDDEIERGAADGSSEGWLSERIVINEESPFAGWLAARISDGRNDARCVDAIDDADRSVRQVQRDGQIKDADRGRHGTKGMSAIIGFVNESYLAQLREEIDALTARHADVAAQTAQADGELKRLDAKKTLAELVARASWPEVDVESAREQVAQLQATIDDIRSNPELERLIAQRDECEGQLKRARQAQATALEESRRAQIAQEAARTWLDAAQMRRAAPVPGASGTSGASGGDGALRGECRDVLEQGYAEFFGAQSQTAQPRAAALLSLEEAFSAQGSHARPIDAGRVMERLGEQAAQTVAERIKQLDGDATKLQRVCETHMEAYRREYLSPDSPVGTRVDDYQSYADDLRELRANVIREAADREYFNSMEKIHKDLQQLHSALTEDRNQIAEQIGKINRLLAPHPFGARKGRLSIVANIEAPATAFMARLRRNLEQLAEWSHVAEPQIDDCKRLFAACGALVEMIESCFPEHAANGRGESYLDARRRSRFSAEVTAADGTVERIASTGGGSGGYLQELTSFAYGAALMYLLANDNATEPSYATVFLDEALIKADGQYTRRALSALPGLGFQVIVSAPESKTGDIMRCASKVVVARKDPATGVTTLHSADLQQS